MNTSEHIVSFAPPENYDGPRRALILAGGGIRVSYQAGVLRALMEADLHFEHVDGTSGGTMNLAMLLSGLSPGEMCKRWRSLNVNDFISLMPIESYLDSSKHMGLGDADGIVNSVFPHLGIDIERINNAGGLDGTFNLCNYSRKTALALHHSALTLKHLVAGISLPIFFPPQNIDGDWYVDAVWIKDANLWESVQRGIEEIWLVWIIGNIHDYKPGAFHQYVHMMEISSNGALFQEFDRIKELNERIRRGDSPYGQQQPIRVHLIKPPIALPLDTDLYLGKISNDTLIDMGYRDAYNYLKHKPLNGVPLEPEATQMSENTIGITFNETMEGGFALGETDPKAGKKRGNREGSFMSMHGTITIGDVERFSQDPEHKGQITGSIDFTPFGENMPSKTGVFNLFSPGDDPKMKYMVYEMGFVHNGKDYYMAGKKEVKDDPGFDLWSDTTTLYTRLHEGPDSSGPVIGAGILSLSVKELIKLVSTVQATGAESLADKARAVTEFGRFFLGELWDSYVKH